MPSQSPTRSGVGKICGETIRRGAADVLTGIPESVDEEMAMDAGGSPGLAVRQSGFLLEDRHLSCRLPFVRVVRGTRLPSKLGLIPRCFS
jgi:hypothetical protein